MSIPQIQLGNSFNDWRIATNTIANSVGDLAVFSGANIGQTSLVGALNNITASFVSSVSLGTTLGSYATIASPALTGTPTAPTATTSDNTTKIATTAFVKSNLVSYVTSSSLSTTLGSYATNASPALTGTPTAPTPVTSDNSTKIATTAYTNLLLNSVASNTVGITIGGYLDFGGTSPPANFLVRPAAQTIVPISSYPLLFAAVLTSFGGNGTTTFGLPYLPVGYADIGSADGAIGSLSVGAVISHNHAPPTGLVAPWLGNSLGGGDGAIDGSTYITPSDRNPISGNTQSTGGAANLAAGIRCLKCVRYI